ncbi:amidohydrolase [Amnibacterium kyonggiense]|uniref:5-methylthioadenosine/S-adenosylhomocysteine deaminase n=1 Tax=Amnibacterium kyonggiense TaxID=595671 RepID=A0A4R7FDH5_9MICO|nr:amidohydrolase [Amnibacterium kyonggiense]TDS75015.1 5-methylthioadenosine/S-adenosylhomocysteine deaminase [Amnibacterium kyonggiense]
MAPVDLLISDATVLTHTEGAAPGYPDDPGAARAVAHLLEHHDVGIADGAIAWVLPTGTAAPEEREGARVIDGRGRLAMPGLINCHTHSAMTMFRGSAEDVPVHSWFNDHIWPMEVNLTPHDVALGARLAIAEMLLAGVTTFCDHYFSMDEIAKEVSASGARAVLAPTYFSSEGAAGLDRSAAFAAEWHGAADGRITAMMGPHATYTVVDADLERTARIAMELGIRTHLHAAEGMFQTESSLEQRGVTPMQVLQDTGLLEAGVLIAHGAGITPDDVRWLAPVADRIGVAACDKVYLKHAQQSTTPVRLLHDAGVPVGIGTDGPASGNTLSVLESMRTLSLVEKQKEADATWLTSAHALDLATRQSALTAGLGDRIGALLPGRRADVVLVDLGRPHLQPLHDIAAALVLSVQESDVRTVLVDGRVVVDEGRLTTLDVQEAIDGLTARIPQLRDRSHGRRIQDYAP